MKVNRCYLVVVSQDRATAEPSPDNAPWEPLWGGAGAVRVFAIDRERCLIPTDLEEFVILLKAATPPANWNEVPPLMEVAQDGRRSRIEAAPGADAGP